MEIFCNISYSDVAERWQINLQDPATPVAEGMFFFHNYLMFFLILIAVFVFWMLYAAYSSNSTTSSKFSHSSILESIWTTIPAIILIFIAAPSFTLLYSLDEPTNPSVSIKIVGHQWYWSYEYCDIYTFFEDNADEFRFKFFSFFQKHNYKKSNFQIKFDSYMINTSDLAPGYFRLLEVDNRLVIPIYAHIRFLITSADVLHSWAVPSLGIKLDATPGRLSQISLFTKRVGTFYGQCSEICGINHGFMPIVVDVVEPLFYLTWLLFMN